MTVVIKKAKSSDFGEIYTLQKKAFTSYTSFGDFESLMASPESLIEHKPEIEVFKLIANTALVGSAYIRKLDKLTCEIYRIFIDPNKQQQGYGSLFLNEIINTNSECTNFVVDTPLDISTNIQFYLKNGFIKDGVKESKGIKLQHFTKKVQRNDLTGLKPSDGGVHLGHWVGNIEPLIAYQKDYSSTFLFADLQVTNSNLAYYEKEHLFKNMQLMLKQMIALGVDPCRVKVMLESKAKLSMLREFVFISDFITDTKLYHVPFLSHVKGTDGAIKMSILNYPILQAMDCILANADVAFSNIDNKVCFEVINDLFKRINNTGLRNYKQFKLITGKVEQLIGFDGEKMSKSKGNCIFMTDSNDELAKKVNKMYTDPNRQSADDPGCIDNNIVFKYLRVFATPEVYNSMAEQYGKGRLGDAETKKILLEILIAFFTPYREKLSAISDKFVDDILNQ